MDTQVDRSHISFNRLTLICFSYFVSRDLLRFGFPSKIHQERHQLSKRRIRLSTNLSSLINSREYYIWIQRKTLSCATVLRRRKRKLGIKSFIPGDFKLVTKKIYNSQQWRMAYWLTAPGCDELRQGSLNPPAAVCHKEGHSILNSAHNPKQRPMTPKFWLRGDKTEHKTFATKQRNRV